MGKKKVNSGNKAAAAAITSEKAAVPVRHNLVSAFWKLAPGFTRWAETHMDEPDLTPPRVRLLILLMENGPMMMRALRDEMGVTATYITALVDTLERDKMVVRKEHETDRRVTVIEITPKAEERMLQGCSDFKERVSSLFTVLAEGEQKQLLKLLEKLMEGLVERKILKDSNYDCD